MSSPPATSPTLGRCSHVCLLAAILAAAAFLRLYNIRDQGLRFVDEGEYCQFGLALLEGIPDQVIDKPGHALLVYWAYRIFGFDMAAPLRLSALLGCATVAAAYGLAWVLYGPDAALIAASALACMPLCLFYQRSAMSDGNYMFCSCVGLLLSACAMRGRPRVRVLWASAAGVAFGFGFCVNPSTILFLVCAAAALLIVGRREAVMPLVALTLTSAATRAGLNAALGPYINWEGVDKLYSFHARWVLGFEPSLWFARNLWAYAGPVIVIGGLAGAAVAARERRRGDVWALTLLAGLLVFSARLSIRFPRVYLPLTVPLVLLTARLGAACTARVHGWRPLALAALCLLVAVRGAWESQRFIRLNSGYGRACKVLSDDGVRKGLTTHSWWTFQTFTRRRFSFVSETLAGFLKRAEPKLPLEFERMASQGFSHLVIDYLFWLYVDPQTRQGLESMLRRFPPAYVVPNPIVSHEATALEDGQLPALEHEPLAHNIYIYRLRDYLPK